MYSFGGTRLFNLVLFVFAFLGITIDCAGDEKGMGQAEVSADTQKAFAEANPSSSTVYILKKGDVVSIILRISTSGETWCRIVLPGQTGTTGYVPCKALTSASSLTPASGANVVQPSPAAAVVRPEVSAPAPSVKVQTLSNNDISEMSGAGLPAEVLIAKIKSSACNFDTTPTALKNLKAGGVPDRVILAMIEAPVGQPKPVVAVAGPTTSAASSSAPQPSAPAPAASDGKTRVLVTDSQSWEARGYSSAGGNRNGWGASSSYSAGARPQTAEIIKTLNERCPQIVVTNRLDKADFVLTLDHEGGKALLTHHNKIAVFNKDGDVIFSKSTISLGNSVKDACQAMLGATR